MVIAPIFTSVIIDETAFLIASWLLAICSTWYIGRQFPDWSEEYDKRRRSAVGVHLPPPRFEVFRSDLLAQAGWFSLPIVGNWIVLSFLPEHAHSFAVFAPIIVVEFLLGWFIQYRRTLNFARDWLIYRRLTEPENQIVDGVIDTWSQLNQLGGRTVSLACPPSESLARSVDYFLPIEVESIEFSGRVTQGGEHRFIVRPLKPEEAAEIHAQGAIIARLPDDSYPTTSYASSVVGLRDLVSGTPHSDQ